MGIEELKEKIKEMTDRIRSLGEQITDLEEIGEELSEAVEKAVNISKQIDKWVQSVMESANSALPDGDSRSEAFAAFYKKGIRDILNDGNIDDAKSGLDYDKKRASKRILELDDEIGGLKGVLEDCKTKLAEFENWLKGLLDGGN